MININDIKSFYKILNNKEVEIRAFNETSKKQFFVNTDDEAIKICKELDKTHNIYFGVNERTPKGSTNKDVVAVTTIPVDIDCVNKPATPEDLDKAKAVCETIINDFVEFGYQKPPYAMSGNGYQIYIQIPAIELNDKNRVEIESKLKQFGKNLINKYSTDNVRLDNVFDLARIMRVPGTFNLKSKTYSTFISLDYTDDVKLRADILDLEIDSNTQLKLPTSLNKHHNINHPFLDFCLTHELPTGERHTIISKNMAIYLYKHPDKQLLSEQYYKIQKGSEGELDNWLKKIDTEGIHNFSINHGELINYTRKYGIPFDWKQTPEYKQYQKEQKFQKVIAKTKEIENNPEYNQLQKDIFQLIALRKREDATELIVKYINDNNYIYTTRHDEKSEMWVYKDGIYIPEGRTKIREICRSILNELHTTTIVNQVITKVEDDTRIDQAVFFEAATKNVEEIPLENGVFNLVTKQLLNFDPTKIFFNKLPIIYDKKAKCPAIEQHLKDVLKTEDDIEIMYELFGYLLWKDHFIEKAVMMVGGGRNGKGKTIDLMKRFVGIDNCASVPLYNMHGDTFRIAELFGKMANLAGDLSSSSLDDTGMFKQITARDLLGAQRKFKSSINFINYSKQIFACNELPRVYDSSEGFWNRWILFEFPFIFLDEHEYKKSKSENKKRMDPSHIDKISTPEELSGLFNMAVEKLDLIRKQKNFSYSKGTNQIKQFWIRGSDSFAAFCMDHLVEAYDGILSKKDLRKAYHKYCKEHKLKGTSDKSMKINLEEEFGAIAGRTATNFDTQEYVWEGVKFNEKSKYNYQNGKIK